MKKVLTLTAFLFLLLSLSACELMDSWTNDKTDEDIEVALTFTLEEGSLILVNELPGVYSLGDDWTNHTCEVIDSESGDTLACVVDGLVDTNSIGEYQIQYTAYDDGQDIANTTITKYVLRDTSLLDKELSEYYQAAEGLFGDELILALREIISDNVSLQSYGDARYILQESDADPDTPDNIICIYLRVSLAGEWDLGMTWNREHVWPVSRMPVGRPSNTTRSMGSDLHSLAPCTPSENGYRGFKYFSETHTSETYAPHEEIRGNLARMMFYMDVMYEDLFLVSGYADRHEHEMGDLDLLLAWHFSDPVDEFEENRQEIIYSYQNNRNPFIDFPHLVELVWWNHPDVLSWFDLD